MYDEGHTFTLYEMPEPLEDVKEAEKKDSVKPLEPKGSIFLKSSDFREAKIL